MMAAAAPRLVWDASALAKRYDVEHGTDTVNAIFAKADSVTMLGTIWSYTETFAVLVRRRNDGRLSSSTFNTAVTALRRDVLYGPNFTLLSVDDATVLASTRVIERHNLNATDAAILAAVQHWAGTTAAERLRYVLVASDNRLLRAAQAEGLNTLNPETVSAPDVPALLSALA